MRKLLASIDKKIFNARPELVALINDVKVRSAAYEQLKAQKEAAKAALKLAEKALKKQLKAKPAKAVVAKKAAKSGAVPKATTSRTKNAPQKKVKQKAETVA